MQRTKSSKVSLLVFLSALVVVFISLTTVLFPSLIIRSTSQFSDIVINPYEIGVWTYPLLIANFILFGIGILYFKNKLPHQITKSIQFIFNFEASKKTAFIVVIIILAIYVIFSAGELASEEIWGDYIRSESGERQGVKDRAYGAFASGMSPSEPHFRYILLNISLNIFGNIRVVPFLASIGLLVLTYYTTKEISGKRFAGIVAMVVVLQSNVFLTYDTSATYDNFWILLYLFSLYTIFKKWPLSPISYVLSIFSKSITAMFLPMTLFFIYKTNMPRQKKIRIAIAYGIIIALGIAALTVFNIGKSGEFDANDFWRGFTSWAFQLRFDGLILIFILPLIVGLFIISRRDIAHADSIMILIIGMLLSAPFLQGFTDFTNQPYRFVPLVVFFAIGVGTILTKTSEQA